MIFVYHQKEFLLLTVQSFLCGTILGAVYDVFRIARLILGMSPGAGVSFETLYKREYPLIGRISRGNEKRKKYESVILFFQEKAICSAALAISSRRARRKWLCRVTLRFFGIRPLRVSFVPCSICRITTSAKMIRPIISAMKI